MVSRYSWTNKHFRFVCFVLFLCLRPSDEKFQYGAFFSSKFNLSLVFTNNLCFSTLTFILLNPDIGFSNQHSLFIHPWHSFSKFSLRFWYSTLTFRFWSSAFVLFNSFLIVTFQERDWTQLRLASKFAGDISKKMANSASTLEKSKTLLHEVVTELNQVLQILRQ